MDNERARGILGLGLVSHSGIDHGEPGRRDSDCNLRMGGRCLPAIRQRRAVGKLGQISWARQTAHSLFHPARNVCVAATAFPCPVRAWKHRSRRARHRGACIPRLDGTRTAFASPFHGRIPLRPGAGRERSNRGEESCGMAGADPAIRILRFFGWAVSLAGHRGREPDSV